MARRRQSSRPRPPPSATTSPLSAAGRVLRRRLFSRPEGGAPSSTVQAALPGPTAAGLVRLAGAGAVALKSVCLAAHLRVLQLAAGRADVLTGLVVNGRPETAGGERVRGLFLNTLPLPLGGGGGGAPRRAAASRPSPPE